MKRLIKLSTSVISVILSISMIFTYLIQVAAVNTLEKEAVINNRSTNTDIIQEKYSENEYIQRSIVGEITSEREEYTKYFRMSDGSIMAAQYEYPVHFKDGDNWVDYDNSLLPEDATVSSEETSKECNNQEDVIESITDTEMQTETLTPSTSEIPTSAVVSSTESTTLGTYITTPTDLQISDENVTDEVTTPNIATELLAQSTVRDVGKATVSTETVTETSENEVETESVYSNSHSNIDIKLAKKSKANNMIKIKFGGYQVSWGYINTNKSNIQLIENTEELKGDERFLARKNLISEAVYENIFDNIDLQCFVTSLGIKENIILKNNNVSTEFEMQYKLNNLTAVQENDKRIKLVSANNETVYLIEAPFMTDSNGASSTQLKLEMVSQKNNKLVIKLIADNKWLSDENRVYPVTIDPTFITSQEWEKTSCAYVDNNNPDTCYGYESLTGYTGTVYVGTYGEGDYKTYIKLNELPSLNKGDMIIDAKLNMHLYMNNFYREMYVGAYQVTSEWQQSTITWNNRASYNSTVLDYEIFSEEQTDIVWHDWDITEIVKKWYNGTANYGVLLKPVDESENDQCAAFYSGSYPSSSIPRPVLQLTYRNNKGLEDYWTYSSFSVGTAGTAYVNDYTGNLTFITSDMSTVGNFSTSVQHIFNNYMANEKYNKSAPYTGLGWKLNVQQTLLLSSEFGLTDESAEKYPYVYTDGDGTDHYFVKETKNNKTTYKDEDGLKLELTINESSENARYTVTNEKGAKLEFNSKGNLYKTIDQNGNATLYSINTTDNIIAYVQDAANFKLTMNRNSYNYITRISDSAGRTRNFIYTGNKLTRIQNPDGTTISFSYDDDGSITSITDIDGYKVSFTYTTKAKGKQVSEIQEYAADGTAGQKITFNRTEYNKTAIRTAGVDGTFGNSDDCISKYQFDNYGRTVSVSNCLANGKEMGASVYNYTAGEVNSDNSNIKQLNRATTNYMAPSNADNLLKNHNMESSIGWTSAAWNGTVSYTTDYSTAQKYFGQKSLKMSVTSCTNDARARVHQDLSTNILKQGNTYTLSAYVKTSGITGDTDNSGVVLGGCVYLTDGTWSNNYSEHVKGTTDSNINNGWKRISVTFTVPDNASYTRINLAVRAATGTAYFDGVQLEEGNLTNNYNILENSGMEVLNATNGIPKFWYGYNLTDNESTDHYSTAEKFSGSNSFMITGDHTAQKWLYQTVPINGSEGDTYIVSGWAKANAVPIDDDNSRKFKISVKIDYSDGTNKFISKPAEFNQSVSSWQYTSATFNLSDGTDAVKTPVSITVYMNYSKQANKVYFDNVQLIKDATQSYTYNSDGELVSVVSNAEQQSTMEYSDSNLTKTIDSKGYAYTYDYDDNHNMTKATSQRGLNYNYAYNSKGLATSLEAKNTSGSYVLKSDVDYTSDGRFATKVYDQDGNYDTYSYNTTTGFLNSVTDNDTGATVNYTYNTNNGNLLSVSQTDSNEDITLSNGYGYSSTGKLLTQISRNGTNYNIEYDKFNNVTANKVGNQVLTSFDYGNNNGLLQKITYGTGQTIDYVYDNYGNIGYVKYNGSTVFRWYSNRSGAITRGMDLKNKYIFSYDYDTTGRLVRQNKTSQLSANKNQLISAFEYSYDLNNNITKLVSQNKNTTVKHQYTYGKDNLLEKYILNGGRQVTYGYDGINRNTSISLNTERELRMEYTYWLSERNTGDSTTYRTTKVNRETIDGRIYYYTYDTNGNITLIQEKVDNVLNTLYAYQYDKFNQMIYAKDYANDTSSTYYYDEGGNIVEEALSSNFNSNGVPANTEYIEYIYGDTNWTDKLTEFDGQEITYDAIGNPLTYRDGMTMTWANGRQLTSLQQGENSIQYLYDSNSIRTSKTVNGVKYTYEYLDGKLMHETRGEAYFDYYYDSNGQLYAISYQLSSTSDKMVYYFTHNWRGDIVGIYNGNGDLKSTYSYDSWGNVVAIKDADGNAITSATHVANLNPFRYRGYYFDTETGLYYLMSRYYDPVTHRFVNSDGYFQSGDGLLDTNMNAYCRNNPVNCYDPTGSDCKEHGRFYIPTCEVCNPEILYYRYRYHYQIATITNTLYPKRDTFGANNKTGFADQINYGLPGLDYYTKNAEYVVDNNPNAAIIFSSFTNTENILLSSVSITTDYAIITLGLDNTSLAVGLPWDGNFYGIEASVSVADGFIGRIGLTTTQRCGDTNMYYDMGCGIEVSLILAAALVITQSIPVAIAAGI